jgi:hypothetical protein
MLTRIAQIAMMRWILPIVPMLALLGACSQGPNAAYSSIRSFGVSPEAQQCLAQLGTTKASFTPLPNRYFSAGCNQVNTVRLASLRSDDAKLRLENLGPVTCPMANSFAGWARYGVDRAARQMLGSELARIETLGSYNCRNVAATDRLSAHGTAGAIDVSAFVLADGRRISVQQDWSQGTSAEQQFLRTIHASACRRFGTVLGPAYNADHADHFHVELSGGGTCR